MAPSATGPSLVARVRRTLSERGLLAARDAVLVACSGGPDSVALLDVLDRLRPELGLSLAVASVDHGLRREAADEVRTVGALAASRDLPFLPLALHLPAGTSSAAARDARYDALLRVAEGRAVAVGHTLDDQAETVLARLLRGAGLEGLRGIAPHRADGVVRPLLDARRADVLAHLAAHGLPFVEDPSNCDPAHQRVRVRHTLLPALAAESPAIAEHLAALADECARTVAGLDAGADGLVEAAVRAGRLEAQPLAAVPRAVQDRVIGRFLAGLGLRPSRAHRTAVAQALRDGGEVWLPGGRVLRGQAGALVLAPAADGSTMPGPAMDAGCNDAPGSRVQGS